MSNGPAALHPQLEVCGDCGRSEHEAKYDDAHPSRRMDLTPRQQLMQTYPEQRYN
jgi:hypothetical protein